MTDAPPMDPKEWTPQEMQALDRYMKANREMRSALDALIGVLPDHPAQLKFLDELVAMRDHYWPFYQEMTLQNLRRQVY